MALIIIPANGPVLVVEVASSRLQRQDSASTTQRTVSCRSMAMPAAEFKPNTYRVALLTGARPDKGHQRHCQIQHINHLVSTRRIRPGDIPDFHPAGVAEIDHAIGAASLEQRDDPYGFDGGEPR
jgi:hypothetical protein